MTSCTFEDRLSPYLDEALPQPEAAELEQHLEGCATCKRELAELRKTLEFLHDLPAVEVPADLARSITMEVAARKERKLVFLPPKLLSMQYVLPLGGIVIALAVGLFMWSDQILLPSLNAPASKAEGEDITFLLPDAEMAEALNEAERDSAMDAAEQEAPAAEEKAQIPRSGSKQEFASDGFADRGAGTPAPHPSRQAPAAGSRGSKEVQQDKDRAGDEAFGYAPVAEESRDRREAEKREMTRSMEMAKAAPPAADPAPPAAAPEARMETEAPAKLQEEVLYAQAPELGHTWRVTVAFPEEDMVTTRSDLGRARTGEGQAAPLTTFESDLNQPAPAAPPSQEPALADAPADAKKKDQARAKGSLSPAESKPLPEGASADDASGLVATGAWTQPVLQAKPERPKDMERLWVLVNANGRAAKAQDLEGNPLELGQHPWLSELRFTPAGKDGNPVPAWVLLEPVTYTLDVAEE